MCKAVKPLTLGSIWKSLATILWDEEEKKPVSYGYIKRFLSKPPTLIRGGECKSSLIPLSAKA
jgi:hypothetical protein